MVLVTTLRIDSRKRPQFNIQFRDDKSYPAIHLSTSKDFPAIYVSRQKDSSNTLFGPFANVGAMRVNVSLIRSLFKIRNCKDINFKNRSRPCIEYQMNRCSAPCVGNISKEDYSFDVKNAINFLSGDTTNVILELQKKMDYYSSNKDYERAAIYRDKVQSIRDTQKKQNVLTGFDDLDVVVIKRNKFNCCISVLRIEDGWITSSKNFYPDSKDNISDQELLSVFLESYVIDNSDRKKINLLFQEQILKETKDFLIDLSSPKVITHKANKQNKNLIDKKLLNKMKPNSLFILMSRAAVVNFKDLINRVKKGDIYVATDVFPEEPVRKNDPIRKVKNILFSAHRAGALTDAFYNMGEIVLKDMDLISKNLKPKYCKRAELKTVSLLASKPVAIN